jgi:hypothetical protein
MKDTPDAAWPPVACDECGKDVPQAEYDTCNCGAEVHRDCMDRHLGRCDGLGALGIS